MRFKWYNIDLLQRLLLEIECIIHAVEVFFKKSRQYAHYTIRVYK